MTTAQLPDTASIEQHEFDIPCEAAKDGCREPAAWQCWLSHAEGGCPTDAFICNNHKPHVERIWAASLPPFALPCPRCHEQISPLLSENLKWVPLRAKAAS